jgi:hypothetical protein
MPHLSDEQILLEIDGELSVKDADVARVHLARCPQCSARRQELETAIGQFTRLHHEQALPPAAGPRALLKAHLSHQAATGGQPHAKISLGIATAACALLVLGVYLARHDNGPQIVSIPNSKLTPGATVRASRREVCSTENTKNKAVPVALQRQVFAAYGIPDAEPAAYEVDYLITPALGGADDIHNLWPHSYSSTVWNAQVKDALEDRLRDLVCQDAIDLTTAQKEIAADWIAAYKKYFRTDHPLSEHLHGGQ